MVVLHVSTQLCCIVEHPASAYLAKKDKKEKTTHFGVKLMSNPVLYRAAQRLSCTSSVVFLSTESPSRLMGSAAILDMLHSLHTMSVDVLLAKAARAAHSYPCGNTLTGSADHIPLHLVTHRQNSVTDVRSCLLS